MKIIYLLTLGLALFGSKDLLAGSESMPSMPKIQPKKIYSVPTNEAGEDLQDQRGFGDQEPMVRMMNLMMVGGSGYEGMDMSEMKMVSGAGGQDHGHGEHAMSSEHEGMQMADAQSGRGSKPSEASPSPAEGQTGTYEYGVKITPDPPRAGTNTLIVTVQNKNTKKPAEKLKIKAQVYMTSMDMGTDEPRVKEVSPGRYQVKVTFSMQGPWAVKLYLPEGGEKVFDFKAGGSK